MISQNNTIYIKKNPNNIPIKKILIIRFLKKYIYIYKTSVLRALIKNLFYESFDTTFMKNEKNYKNINYFFFLFP